MAGYDADQGWYKKEVYKTPPLNPLKGSFYSFYGIGKMWMLLAVDTNRLIFNQLEMQFTKSIVEW